MPPIIGITPSPTVDALPHGVYHRFSLAANYVNAILAAGGLPVILPPQERHNGQILDMVDGLLFSGGADLDPSLYGDASVHPQTYGIDKPRDRFELSLIASALERDMPMLCICRGIQVLNVALGGTLIQDIPDQLNREQPHRQHELGIDSSQPSHSVEAAPDSLLAAIYGTTDLRVNSYHHQSIKAPASALTIAAASPDGVIEAVVAASRSFVCGLQWHPELMFHEHAEHLRPFIALVEAAAVRRLASVSK